MGNDQTHHSTIEAEVRRIANSCDLGGMNTEFFLKATFVMNIASLIKQKEAAAYQRGLAAGRSANHPTARALPEQTQIR